MELSNNIKQFISKHDYNCTIIRAGGEQRISIGEIIQQYLKPIKDDTIFQIGLLDTLIDNAKQKREDKGISNTLLLHYNYEIQRLESIKIALTEVLTTL